MTHVGVWVLFFSLFFFVLSLFMSEMMFFFLQSFWLAYTDGGRYKLSQLVGVTPLLESSGAV